MSKEMKIIMENWRKFSNSEQFIQSAKNIIIENKNYNSSLETLLLEYKNNKISTKKYINILQESIDNDLKNLSLLNKQVLNEVVQDTLKKVGQNIKGALSSALEAAIKKVNDIIMKVSLMIWNAPRQAALNISKIIPYVKNFKKANPNIYAFLIISLKIIGMAAIAYAFLHPGTAEASVQMDKIGGGVKIIDGSSPEGQQLLGALKVLSPENLQGTSLEGIDSEKLKQASDILQKAVMSKKPEQIQGALKTILNAADTLSKQASNSNEGATLQKLGQKVVEVANLAVQKSQAIAAPNAGGLGGIEINNISDINSHPVEAILKYVNNNPDLKDTGGVGINPRNVIDSLLGAKKDMSSLEYKKALQVVTNSIPKALQQINR